MGRFLTVCILLICIFSGFAVSISAQSQLVQPIVTNYKYTDYQAGPVNWWAIEDNRGIMYFANGAGVLEYDGATWRVIEGTSREVRSLAKDENGVIHVGLNGDIGYLEPDEKGEIVFRSLRDKIPEDDLYFEEVWETDYWRGAIYFRTNNKMFVWDGESMKVIHTENAMHVGAVVHDEFYVRVWNEGLCRLEGDSFVVVPNGERFADERIYVMLPYDNERMLIGTRNLGLFIYDGQDFTPFKTEADQHIRGDLYLPGLALGDGRFVLNTFTNGIHIIDRQGNLLQFINQDNGLQDNSVDFLYLDSRGLLWMPLFNGIASVNINSPISRMNGLSGLPSPLVFDAIKYQGRLYAGTNNGTYYFDEQESLFKQVEGTIGQMNQFVLYDNRLYSSSGDMGVIEITGNTFQYVRKSINYDFQVSSMFKSRVDSNRIYLDRRPGLSTLYFDPTINQFREESNTDRVHPTPPGFDEDREGNIWTRGDEPGTLNVLHPEFVDGKLDLEASGITVLDSSNGLPDERIGLWYLNGKLEFFSRDTTYTYDAATQMFHPAPLAYEEQYNPEALFYAQPVKDHLGRTWFGPGTGVLVSIPGDDESYEFIHEPFLEVKNAPVWNISIDPISTPEHTIAWLSAPDGLMRYEGNLQKPELPPFAVLIRRLAISNDSVLYAGGTALPEEMVLTYKSNQTFNFNFASPFFIGENDIKYQTFLEGLDDDWSAWTKQSNREYINLSAGTYVFKVRGQNLYGAVSEPAELTFRILPPWYASWWAYILYVLGFVVLVYAIVSNRTKMLRHRQKELEEKVQERTAEVQQRVKELATVNRVSRALTETLQFNDLVQFVGDQMRTIFNANITYLAILDEKKGIINFPYQNGDDMQPIQYGEGLTSRIITTKEPLLINRDISKEYDELGIERVGKNAASYLGVPITIEDKVIGVLSVQSTEKENRFDNNDKRLLNTIARHVGIALHNAELYEDAQKAKALAEDANEAKSAFLSTVSHELRTPLTSVLGFAKIIRKRLEDKIFPAVKIEDQKIKKTMKQVSENLDVVVSEGERLTNLINDVLDLAKIESGRMEWNMKPVFMQDIVSRAISSTASLFENKNLGLIAKVPSDLPVISGDQDKLIQVVINLLSNAVKFTEKGNVTVEAYEDSGQIIIEVQDTGIGISEEDKHKVFERFRQAGDTLTDKPQGTGLGLPICREIIEHHGGIIWMKSEKGVGSTFFFSIPVLGDAAGKQPIQLEKIVKSLKKQIESSTLPKPESSATILVVDDDTPIRSLLRQELGDAGYNVKEAANGKAALDMVRMHKPDLIILDVMMPEINGFDVAAVLKNDPDTMDIPIIILSIVQDQERGFQIGVDRYLTKPIDTEKLFNEIDVLLEQGVSKKKVLVVDEDSSTVKTLTEVLNARGYKVLESNGKDLIETAMENQPDIIMLSSVYKYDTENLKKLKMQNGMENVLFFVYQ